MSWQRSETWPNAAFGVRRLFGGRVIAHYLTDLAVSVLLVLSLGWMFQTSVDEFALRNALMAQNELYVEISRFTPRNLFTAYAATLDQMIQNLGFGYAAADGLAAAVGQALAKICYLILDVMLAVPCTLIELYEETDGMAAWLVLAGYAMAIGSVLAWLLIRGASLWRLLLAAVLSPVAISVVFLVLQGFMAMMLDTFFWFTVLAPYTVACPVLCTFYWVVFPNAERGATATVAHVIGRAVAAPR